MIRANDSYVSRDRPSIQSSPSSSADFIRFFTPTLLSLTTSSCVPCEITAHCSLPLIHTDPYSIRANPWLNSLNHGPNGLRIFAKAQLLCEMPLHEGEAKPWLGQLPLSRATDQYESRVM